MHHKTKKILVKPATSLAATSSRRMHALAALFMSKIGRHITVRRSLLVGGGLVFVLGLSLTVSFYLPRTVAFSYSQSNCFTNPLLLPNIVAKKQSPTFKATLTDDFTVAGYPIYSRTTCVVPLQPPVKKIAETVVLGSVLKKNIRVTPGALPVIQDLSRLDKPVSTQDPLTFTLDRADNVFEYELQVNGQKVNCSKRDRAIICPTVSLQLIQSTQYTLVLQRLFNRKPAAVVAQHAFTTVESMQVTAANVAADQTMYTIPDGVTLTLNKTAASFKNIHVYQLNGADRQEAATTVTLGDKTLVVHFTQPLPRSASFILSAEQIIAADGGYLQAAYTLPFKTSGGPKVLGVNIGSYKVQAGARVVISFDSPLSATQAVDRFVSLESDGVAVAASVTVDGNSVTVTPSQGLARCAHLTVKVLDGLQSAYGVTGGGAWQFKSRVICQTVFSIGASVQGRAITAYSFGSGGSKMIFVGTTHGDEKSSTYTLNSFVDYLEANADGIPANRTIIVIPDINPDGYAANRRTNAHGVDLNRNFPANDWKSDVTMPDQSFHPGGGGSAPLSEPESSALANYVLGQSPRLVLTYHAVAGVVIPNDSGDSVALAHLYDQKSNLYFNNNSETDSVFHYDTTGSFETWLHDKHDIPALLLELWTMSGNEFGKNQSAMWAIAQTP